MNNKKRWVKIQEKFLDWEWYKNQNTKSLFIHCILKANWKDGKFMGNIIPRGSFVTSLGTLSEETGMSVKSIRIALEHLISTGELASKSTNKYRIITVKNYELYQEKGKQIGSQEASKGQADDKQRATIEEYKNNRIKEYKKCVCNTDTPTLEMILNFALKNFQEYLKSDIETSCNKFFNFYEEKEWENVKKWENKLNLWISEDIAKKRIKKDEVESTDDRAKRIFGSN